MDRTTDDAISELAAENQSLRKALEPFARFAAMMDCYPHVKATPDEAEIHPGLTVGHFRAAGKAIGFELFPDSAPAPTLETVTDF